MVLHSLLDATRPTRDVAFKLSQVIERIGQTADEIRDPVISARAAIRAFPLRAIYVRPRRAPPRRRPRRPTLLPSIYQRDVALTQVAMSETCEPVCARFSHS